MTQDKMVGQYHRLNGDKFEPTLGDSDGQGSLQHCSPWDHKVRHDFTTKQQQHCSILGLLWWLSDKESTCNAEDTGNAGDLGSVPGLGRYLKEGMATHSSILAWEILRAEESGGLQSMGSQTDMTEYGWVCAKTLSANVIHSINVFI